MDANDMKALREALENLVDVIDRYSSNSPLWWHCGAKGVMPLKNAKAALSAPPRNCDVGTASEQAERFVKHCQSFLNRDGIKACMGCPCCGVVMYGKCELAWAQMPYDEGGAK